MYIQQAFSLPFDDPRWSAKLLPLVGLSLLVLIPVVGLIPLALILGWVVALVANIRQGDPQPLPEWRDMGRLLTIGADVLLIVILAHLPILILFFIAWLLGSGIGSTFYAIIYNFGQFCCLLPLSLVYALIAWVLIGLGILDYSETLKRQDLYRVRYHWDRARTHASLISGWLARVLIVTLGLALIPVVGWIMALLMYWPVQGILLGQLGRQMDGRQPGIKGR